GKAIIPQAQGCNARCVDNARHALCRRGLDQVERALNIDAVHFFVIRNPNAIVCGNVKYGFAAPHGTLERIGLCEIANSDLTADTGQVVTVAVWTDERADI